MESRQPRNIKPNATQKNPVLIIQGPNPEPEPKAVNRQQLDKQLAARSALRAQICLIKTTRERSEHTIGSMAGLIANGLST